MILKTKALIITLLLIAAIFMISPSYASYRLEVSPTDSQTVQLYFSDDNEALHLSDYSYALSAASDVRAFAQSHGMVILRSNSNIADEIMAHAFAWHFKLYPGANPMDLTMDSNSWIMDTAKDMLRRGVRFLLD